MKSILKVIAVDDEFRALEVIERYASNVPFLDWKGGFKNPIEALTVLKSSEIDLIFLDINMPHLSGTALAKLLKADQQVIFTTAYSEYAVEGFSLNATDYLLKPIEFDRFLEACLKAKDRTEAHSGNTVSPSGSPEELVVSIKSGIKIERVNLEEILFFEKQGNDMLVHTLNREVIRSRMNMKDLFDLISHNDFSQIHKSFVVALNKVDTIESYQVIIKEHQIPIGRNYRKSFLSRLHS